MIAEPDCARSTVSNGDSDGTHEMSPNAISERAQKLLLPATASIRQAVEVIEAYKSKIVLVTDMQRRLIGTVTDGDIRRGFLRGFNLESPIERVMNNQPMAVSRTEGRAHIFDIMRQHNLRQIPVLDETKRVIDVGLINDFLLPEPLDNLVVIMAGGEGKRLRPLTESVPKPMLPVGGRPILETVVNRFAQQGLVDLVLSVNYRADVIRRHFADGRAYNVRIRYLEEPEPLGTAGALRLLPERPKLPFLVVNGDVLTTLSYRDMLSFHRETKAFITLCVQHYPVDVPFGVVSLDGERVRALSEKPIFDYFISSGIYALDPEALDLLPANGRFDMPQIINIALERGAKISAFPIREYWVDVGRPEDLRRAHDEFATIFG